MLYWYNELAYCLASLYFLAWTGIGFLIIMYMSWIEEKKQTNHYDDVIMGTIASQITSLTSVYLTVYSGADQSKHQSSASLAFVWGIHRGPVNSPHKWPVTRKMFPFDDVIMKNGLTHVIMMPQVSRVFCLLVFHFKPHYISFLFFGWRDANA